MWKLAQQCGVTLAVGGLPFRHAARPGEKLGDLAPLTRMKADYEAGGFKLVVIRGAPALNKTKRGLEGRRRRDRRGLRPPYNMGQLGFPVWCYEWMTDFNWVRTNSPRRRAAARW